MTYAGKGDWLLSIIDAIVLVLEVWLVVEAWGVIRKYTSTQA
jgi:hypothetical protein